MKTLLFVTLLLLSTIVSAHEIEGTLVLKGKLTTNVWVDSYSATCGVRIKDVKNLKVKNSAGKWNYVEDSYGNPAYNVWVNISLSGGRESDSTKIRYNKEMWMNNLFLVGSKTEVRDLEYATNDGVKMMIDQNGRIKSVSVKFPSQTINCSF